MELQNVDSPELIDPKALAIKMIAEKNNWLIKLRWFYSLFILMFFSAYNYLSDTSIIGYRALFLIVALAVLGNVGLYFTLKRHLGMTPENQEYGIFSSLAGIQLDLDLVILSLLIFYSGGFDSPVIVLFIFYIMVSTFVIYHKKAFQNALTAVVLVVVIFFANKGLEISSAKLTEMTGFTIILVFAFLVSGYLSRNLRKNETALRQFIEETRELSITDGLTNLYDHSHFFMLLNLQLEKAKRYDGTFSVIMFDVDRFKTYNDANGHLMGSELLKRVAEMMQHVFRSSDILARYGGDEFAVILSESDKVGAYLAADRLRELVEKEPFPGRESQPRGKITLSMGVAAFPDHGETVDDLLDAADRALYMSKEAGRNRVMIYDKKYDKK